MHELSSLVSIEHQCHDPKFTGRSGSRPGRSARCSAPACSARIAACLVSDIAAGHPRSTCRASSLCRRPYPLSRRRPYSPWSAVFLLAFSSSSSSSRAEPCRRRPVRPWPCLSPIPRAQAFLSSSSTPAVPPQARPSPTPAGVHLAAAGRH